MTDADRVEHVATAARDPRTRRRWMILGAWMVASIAGLGVFAIYQYAQSQDQKQEITSLSSQIGALASAANQNAAGERTLANQVQQLGGTPAVRVPTGAVGPTGPQGPGPSQAQIDDAVNRYFVAHPLPPGQLPTAAQVAAAVAAYLSANPPVTPAQVVAAVVSYCSTANGCRGPSGADGQNATDAQVKAAVQAYCSQPSNPCQGPAGAQGPIGPQGPQGDPGPACPAGYTQHDALISEPTSDPNDPLVTSTQVSGVACVADTTATTTSTGLLHGHR